MKTLAELQQLRAKALKGWKDMVAAAETETRDLTEAEETRADELQAEIASLDKQIARARALQEAERSSPAVLPRTGDGRWEDRAAEFSITTAIRAQMGERVDDGRERELSAELVKRTGRTFKGIAVPSEAFGPVERRVMLTSGTPGSLVPQVLHPEYFINRLRPSNLADTLGITVLDDLGPGDHDIPRPTRSAIAEWVAEDAPLTDSDLGFDDVQLRPRTVGALTSYSRRLLLNATPGIEQIVRNDLARVIAEAIDEAMLFGAGGGVPLGITLTPGVREVSLAGGATWEGVLEFVASVEGANALQGGLGWALSAWASRELRATLKVTADAGAGFIMERPGELAGYRAAVSSTVPGDPDGSGPTSAMLVFGNWQDVILAAWSGVDILANPFADSAFSRGRVLVRAMRDVDVAVRHAESFAFCDDLPVSAGPSA